MSARFRASTHFKPEITPEERAHRLTSFSIKVANMIHQIIQDRYRDPSYLAFWLANSSELLHFLKQDKHLSAFTFDAQDILAEGVQSAFRSLVMCQQLELQNALPAFLEDIDDINDESVSVTTSKILNVLSSAMALLRRCRVNAALTIQLFSQLFHFINMWLFNKVVGCAESSTNYCSRVWGLRLKRRLIQIEVWAEKQGLELAADCHLNRIVQTAHLLQSPKSNAEDISNITSKCFKLNSLQLRALLERYETTLSETPIPRELIESVVKVAENTADELARTDGREIRLEEEPDLQLPFLLPEDGYSCDIVRGIPAGLVEFIQPLVHLGLCHLTIQPTSSGYWTIYMISAQDSPITPRNSKEIPTASSEPPAEHVSQTNTSAPISMGSLLMPQQQQQQQQQQAPPQQQQLPQPVPNISGRASAVPVFNEPELHVLKLQKSNNGMGLSIVAARGVNQDRLGIYIKSVVKGGAADQVSD
jgi:afadin